MDVSIRGGGEWVGWWPLGAAGCGGGPGAGDLLILRFCSWSIMPWSCSGENLAMSP